MNTIALNHELDWLVETCWASLAEAGIDREKYQLRNNIGGILDYYSIVCWVYNINDVVLSGPHGANGCGFDVDFHQSQISSIAEAFERYCLSSIRNTKPLQLALNPNAAHVGKLPADDWPTYSDWQLQDPDFPFQAYDPDKIIDWALADGMSAKDILIPASLIWQGPMDDRFMPVVSSGTACHSCDATAMLSGIFEVVERDSFMIAWTRRAILPLLPMDSVWMPESVQELSEFFSRVGCDLKLRDATTNLGIPTVLAVVENKMMGKPAICVGAATRFTLAEAATKAAREAYQTWCWMADEHSKLADDFATSFAKLKSRLEMSTHPILFGHPEASAFAVHLTSETKETSDNNRVVKDFGSTNPVTPEMMLDACLTRLSDAGFNTYRVKLSPDELDISGLKVFRVIVPGLVPISVGHQSCCLAHPRIATIPEICGWAAPPFDASAYPPPHPFP